MPRLSGLLAPTILLTVLLSPASVAASGTGDLERLEAVSLQGVDETTAGQIESIRKIVGDLEYEDGSQALEIAAIYGQLGRIYLRLGKLDAAANAFRNARTLDDDDPSWPYYLGVIRVGEGDTAGARKDFLAALERAPDDLATLVRLGRLAVDDREFETAIERFQEALRIDPACAAALFGLGRAELGLGRTQDAIDHLEAALELEPTGTAAHRVLAMAYAAKGDSPTSEEHLALAGDGRFELDDPRVDALESPAVAPYVHFAEAVRAVAAGDLPAAAQADQQALAADPTDTVIRLHLALVLARARQVATAKQELAAVIEQEPDNARAHLLLGTAQMSQGELDSAKASLERAIAADPDNIEALATLGTLEEQRQDLAAAESAYRRAAELDPESSENRFQYAKILGMMGRLEEARGELEAVLERDPTFGEAILSIGFQQEQAGETEQAIERYRAAAALDDQPQVQGIALVRLQDLLAASGATPELPDSPAATLAMANSLARLGRYEEAAVAFDRVVTLDPRDPEGHVGRSLSRLFAGQDRRALADLETGLATLPNSVPLAHLLARLLATSPDATLRDGERALALAQRAARAEERVDYVETVAMALAELGRYDEAADLQSRILAEARRVGATPLVPTIEERLRTYQSQRPVRDVWRSASGDSGQRDLPTAAPPAAGSDGR